MQTIKNFFLTLLLFLTVGTVVNGQILEVDYQLKYDTTTCLYDCYLIIVDGDATDADDRIQFNAQYSIQVPKGTTVALTASFMPLQGNANYDGVTPMNWSLNTDYQPYPLSDSTYNYYQITPDLGLDSRFNDLYSGDTIKLFSLSLSPTVNCAEDIRIWDNGIDPQSSDPDMEGRNFNNGYTIGSSSQLYIGNAEQLYPPKPIVSSLVTACTGGIEINLTAFTSACQGTLSYAWTGPDSYTSTTEDVSIDPTTPANNGIYQVVITDDFGCVDSVTIEATTKPNAGPDVTVCAGTVDTLEGQTPNTGTWSQVSNPPGAVLAPLSNGKSQVTFSASASGVYSFKYDVAGVCSDTMQITVNAKPVVTVPDNSICIGDTTNILPASGGTWISNVPGVATIDNAGMVIGIMNGTATFKYTDAAGCANTTAPITVNAKPNVAITGSDDVCIGSTTNLTPTSGGTWTSSADTVATVTNGGLVTGISTGTVTLVYQHATTMCIADPLTVNVLNKPIVSIVGSDSICVNGSTQLSPSTGGAWASTKPLIATSNNTGLVTGLSVGQTTFIFTQATTQCSSFPTDTITVTPAPTIAYNGARRICELATTAVTPTIGGVWTSSNPLVATITNAGVVTAVGAGQTTLTFTDNATGCFASLNPALIVDPIPIVDVDEDTICVSELTNLISSTGTWTNHTTSILTLNNSAKTILGIASGTGKLTFKATSGGCPSDTLYIIVRPKPAVTIANLAICVNGTTNVTPTSGGSWTTSDGNIATVTNAGLVTGKNAGFVTFRFTSATTQCQSDPTTTLEVKPVPPVFITGDDELCIGEFSAVTPTTGGTWVSSNPSVATITNAGVITAVGAGIARFTFTDSSSGCVSSQTLPITVKEVPVVNFNGPSSICIGLTTNVSPATGGIWVSNNPAVATVTNGGVVTGYSAGTAVLTYTETATDCSAPGLTVTILPKPIVSITGPAEICIGASTTMTPTSGGGWASSNPGVATVTGGGVVTGVMNGTSVFTFTSNVGCASSPSDPIVVNDGPTLIYPDMEMCIGDTLTLSPITGNWESSDSSAVLPIGNGKIVALAAINEVFMTYTDTITGCSTVDTDPLKVNTRPTTNLQDDETCVGGIVTIAPFGGGTWQSSNPSIATINNNGQITTLDTGKVSFIYTRLATGCISNASDSLTITAGPDITRADDELCIGETSSLTPTTGGTWSSNNTGVATVTAAGAITAIGPGFATFTFIEDVTLCSSTTEDALVVNDRPTTILQGDSVICIGGFTQFDPSTGGTWVSSDPSVATITDAGMVTGIAIGNATFIFTDVKGCSSLSTESIRVSGSPVAEISGLTQICIGATTTLSPSSGGTWTSSDPTVATVLSNGVVTAISPGIVTFLFQETATGCSSQATTGELTITNCVDPDFNVTYVDVPVTGDVSTNDDTTVGTTYGPNPSLISKPVGSVETLVLASDGTYVFTANAIGVYVYEVPVCVPPLIAGCATSTLTITVLDHLSPANGPVANVDLASTLINTPVELFTLSNDKCLVTLGCTLDPALVTITSAPSKGNVTVNSSTGNTTYTPNLNSVGIDTLTYQVCVTGDVTNCASAKQIIVINSAAAINTTVAADDFNSTSENQPVSGDVSTNDNDPEGDAQTVTAYSTTVAAGTLDLLADGTYTFTPTIDFFGPVEFIYTTCDDNTNVVCADATLHIIVVPDLAVRVRVYLEGSLQNNSNAKGTTHTRPLMRDNLRKSPYNNNNYIPGSDPYEGYQDLANYYYLFSYPGSPQFAYMVSKFSETSVGTTDQFKVITDSTSVFAVTGEDAIVDWVWIELRHKSFNDSIMARRSGLLQRDGDVVDLNGQRSLRFPGISWDDYYVTVRHRNHLGAMTAGAQTPKKLNTLVDFTTPNTPIYDKGVVLTNGGITVDFTGLAQKRNAKETYFALWAGDFDGNGRIKVVSPNDDMNEISSQVLNYVTNVTLGSNYDFAYGYRQADWDLNAKVKFDNPDDDKNMLFASLLFYPLNVELAANYDLFVEQLPEMEVD